MFVLRISVPLCAIEQIKSELTKSLPEVKSSHRAGARTWIPHLCGAARRSAVT